MSVDAEIDRVREAIARVHLTFASIASSVRNVSVEVERRLDSFSGAIGDVRNDVQNVRYGVTHITDKVGLLAIGQKKNKI